MKKTSWLEPLGPTQLLPSPLKWDLHTHSVVIVALNLLIIPADACLDEAETAALSLGDFSPPVDCFAIQGAQTESR